jgi:hypothetical protein
MRHVEMSVATPDDYAKYETFDYTKLTAINTCPVWGIIRYSKHLAMPGGGGRQMALEAGTVMHECFAAIRLFQVMGQQQLPDHAEHHGRRLFGADRWAAISAAHRSGADAFGMMRNGALECLATAGYVDDPFDKYRTFTNLETSLLYYVQRWDAERYPVYIADEADPTALIGVEIPFGIKVRMWDDDGAETAIIYTGRIDGLHVNPRRDGSLLIQENKTAARLNEAWVMSFDMSHQVTGYCVAASLVAERPIERGLVLGLAIPLPREASAGLSIINTNRPTHMKARWLDWVAHTIMLFNQHKDNPLAAPRFTHSCNRYFKPCSYIPLCTADAEEQANIYKEMVKDEWSPLHDKAGD